MNAADGKIGYELAIQHIPDLIITDVMMPERDGIELCRMLKNEMLTQHIPIIILSAKSTIEDTLEGLKAGADDYIPKPFNEQILLAKVRTLPANRQKASEKSGNEHLRNCLPTGLFRPAIFQQVFQERSGRGPGAVQDGFELNIVYLQK